RRLGEALLEVAGEVAGHHAALELGVDLGVGREPVRGVVTGREEGLACDVRDDVEAVAAREVHGVPRDAAAVDGHPHLGCAGLSGHGAPPDGDGGPPGLWQARSGRGRVPTEYSAPAPGM